jgi:F-type H+-transporting ATPase subunit c
MIETAELLHYITIGATVGINSIGVGLGEGLTSMAAIEAINIQPSARNNISKVSILGTALIETAAILGVTFSILLLFETRIPLNIEYKYIAEIGIAFALCFSGFFIGWFSSLPSQAACYAIARQPFFAQKILRLMLITQSIIQTPIILGFIVSMFINTQSLMADTLTDAIRLISSGLCIGLGSIGPAIGLARFAQSACIAVGANPRSYNKIFPFTLISQAIIETPILFALIISMLLIIFQTDDYGPLAIATFCAASISIGLGTLGPGISSGETATAAVKQIALKPELYSMLSKTSMFGQGLIDTCAIYSLMISLLILLVA